MATNIKSVLAKIQKKYTTAVRDVKTAGTIKRIFLNSPSLNFIFGGGFGLGRIYEFYGKESSGKSTLATYIAGELQKKYTERPIVLYVDFERSFDAKYAETLGLDTSDELFIFLRPDTGEDAFAIIKDLLDDLPIGLVIIDSIATTPSRVQVEDFQKADFGSTAKVYSSGLKYINPHLDKRACSLILINQLRANVGKIGPGPDSTTTGGWAPRFYASWRGSVTRIGDITEKGITVGLNNKVKCTKSKIGIPKREAELNLKFATGFEADAEYVGFLIDLQIIERKGAWFQMEDWGMKVQGRDGVLDFLKANPEIFTQAKNMVDTAMLGTTVIDAANNEDEDDDEDFDPEEDALPGEAQ